METTRNRSHSHAHAARDRHTARALQLVCPRRHGRREDRADLDDLKPEATYFTNLSGSRGAVIVVDVPEPSAVPSIAEPWFLTFNAEVRFRIVMSPEDLEKADLESISKKWG